MRPSPPTLCDADWLFAATAQAVFRAIEAGGHGARAVGGSVRNALLGLPVRDVDIATTATPDEVTQLAAAAGLKTVATGICHGTVTVVSGGVPYEVTTLRRDVETFGRKARIAFSADWAEDARRRDFTINALYCDRGGAIHDPLGGYADIEARRVRFIGDAHARIREDYLRILRFFRFTAEYGHGEGGHGQPDAEGLAACVGERGGLALISAERIRAELMKLLAAPGALPAVRAMTDGGITTLIVAEAPDVAMLARLVDVAALGLAPDPVLRLAALAAREPADGPRLKERLRLSSAEADELTSVAGHLTADIAYDPASDEHLARAHLYRLGSRIWSKRGLLVWAHVAAEPGDAARRHRLELPLRWTPPVLPVRGADVIARGVASGPAVGRTIERFERVWIDAGFPSDPALIEARLAEAIAAECC